jgi:hypothetical protein
VKLYPEKIKAEETAIDPLASGDEAACLANRSAESLRSFIKRPPKANGDRIVPSRYANRTKTVQKGSRKKTKREVNMDQAKFGDTV